MITTRIIYRRSRGPAAISATGRPGNREGAPEAFPAATAITGTDGAVPEINSTVLLPNCVSTENLFLYKTLHSVVSRLVYKAA